MSSELKLGAALDPDAASGAVGETVVLGTADNDDYVVTWTKWTLLEPASILTGYTQTNNVGQMLRAPVVAEAPRNRKVMTSQEGSFPFEVTITYRGRQKGDLDQKVMTGSINGRLARVGARTAQSRYVSVYRDGDGRMRMGLGRVYMNNDEPAGVGFTFEVTNPPNVPGLIGVIQLVRGFRKLTRPDRTFILAHTGGFEVPGAGEWFLDNGEEAYKFNDVLYAQKSQGSGIPGTPPPVLSVGDSPNMLLRPGFTRTEVNEEFRTHICFKSDYEVGGPSVWISLGYSTWGWRGIATRPGVNDEWTLESSSPRRGAPPTVIPFIQDGTQPQWRGNSRDLVAIIGDGGAPGDGPTLLKLFGGGIVIIAVLGLGSWGGVKLATMRTTGSPSRPVGETAMAVWARDEDLETLRKISGVQSVTAIAPGDKIVRGSNSFEERTFRASKRYVVRVAPHCLYDESVSDDDVADLSPFPLSQAIASIIRLSDTINLGAKAEPRDRGSFFMEMSRPPTIGDLEWLGNNGAVYSLESWAELR